MGKALQIISGRVTNPGAAVTALTPNAGDSFTVRSFDMSQRALLIQAWAQGGTAGVLRIRSPRLHDNAQGIRTRYIAATPQPLLPFETQQPLYSQDPLAVEQSGGGAETDLGVLLVYYPSLDGVDAALATWDEIKSQVRNIVGLECNLTTGAVAGQYGGSQALNASFDNLKRDARYAVLGYVTDATVGVVGLSGVDTGNLRVGGPGITRADVTEDWFVELAERLGLPTIPIIHGANVPSVTVDLAATATAQATNVVFNLAELPG